MMLNKNKILAIIVIITILAIQFSYVKAEETNSYTPIELDITVNNNQQKLKVINKDNAWYAEAYALGNLAHSSKSAKEYEIFATQAHADKGSAITFMRVGSKEYLLYSIQKESCININNEYYVPMKEACPKLGILFTVENGTIYCNAFKTHEDLIHDISEVFSDRYVDVGSSMIDNPTSFAINGVISEVYSCIPFVGDTNVIDYVTGKTNDDRLQKAFTNLLNFSENEFNFCKELSDDISASEAIRTASVLVSDASNKGGTIEEFLDSNGVSEDVISLLVDEYPSAGRYISISDYLKDFNTVVEKMKIGDMLDFLALLSVTSRLNESTINSFSNIFKDCKDKSIRKAAKTAYEIKYPEKLLVKAETDWAKHITAGLIIDNLKTKLTGNKGVPSLKSLLIIELIDLSTNEGDKARAFTYLSVYSSIQKQILNYYYANQNTNDDPDMRANLKLAALLYSKCAVEAYSNFNANGILDNLVGTPNWKDSWEYSYMTHAANHYLKILSYPSEDDSPDYSKNQMFFDWLNNNHSSLTADNNMPESLDKYLGITVKDVADIWGNDYVKTDYWFLGGYLGFYYKDNRTPIIFYIDDQNNTGTINSDDVIVALEACQINTMLTSSIPCHITYDELIELNLGGELSDGAGEFWDYSYYCNVGNNISVVFGWNDAAKTGYPNIFIYSNDSYVNEETSDVQYSDSDEFIEFELEDFIGSWHTEYIDNGIPACEIDINAVDSEGVLFDVYWYRLDGYDNVKTYYMYKDVDLTDTSAHMYFVTENGGGGTLEFEPGRITLEIVGTSYVDGTYVFETRGDRYF